MYKNLLVTLAILGMAGCGHNPEINTANKKSYVTAADIEDVVDISAKNKSKNITMYEADEMVPCYYWIPLEIIEQDKKE
tara:strand:+ start:156 stop:392 length:237 start_codon:yes stop_codon:yes gene_type:complete